jgi:hypothetical protein
LKQDLGRSSRVRPPRFVTADEHWGRRKSTAAMTGPPPTRQDQYRNGFQLLTWWSRGGNASDPAWSIQINGLAIDGTHVLYHVCVSPFQQKGDAPARNLPMELAAPSRALVVQLIALGARPRQRLPTATLPEPCGCQAVVIYQPARLSPRPLSPAVYLETASAAPLGRFHFRQRAAATKPGPSGWLRHSCSTTRQAPPSGADRKRDR